MEMEAKSTSKTGTDCSFIFLFQTLKTIKCNFCVNWYREFKVRCRHYTRAFKRERTRRVSWSVIVIRF